MIATASSSSSSSDLSSSMANNGQARLQGNMNRRALGDIGNLVGALSQRCIVSKDGLPAPENPKAASKQQADHQPITRRNGTTNTQQAPPKPKVEGVGRDMMETENVISWGAKQRRTSRGREPLVMPSTSDNTIETCSSFGTLQANGEEDRKEKQTLTAILTSRSKAACVGYEVEMEEANEDIADIDKADAGNQLAVVDYIEDIYSFYRKMEIQSCVAPDYMSQQPDINEKMRAILVDWLIEVHLKFKLMPETLFLTINLIDRFLACESVVRKELQLVGVTAMLIAAKYEEIWAPEVQDFVFITDNAYTRDQVLDMEKKMLNKLKFNLTVPTPYVFLVRFLKAAESDTKMEMLAFFLVELCLTEYAMVGYAPSLLAASAVLAAQRTLHHTSPSWTPTLQHYSHFSLSDLRECGNMMVGLHANAGKGKLTVVHKKYSASKFSSVATLIPPPIHQSSS